MIISFAAAGDGRIWVSTQTGTRGEGTYTFDITAATWRKEGDWALPFQRQLQYIPDYNLCFGSAKSRSTFARRILSPPVARPRRSPQGMWMCGRISMVTMERKGGTWPVPTSPI
jgi:hypothetical protein